MSSSEPAAPRWIGPHGLAAVTVGAIASSIIGAIAMGHRSLLAIFTTTAIVFVVTAVTILRVLRLTPKHGRYLTALAAGAIAGPIGAAMAVAAELFFSPDQRIELVLIPLLGGLIGIFVGPLIGLISVPFTTAARDWNESGAHDAFNRALAVNATVLFGIGLITALLQSSGGERGWDGPLTLLLATVGFGWLVVRARARRRWLGAVLAGKLEEWSVVDASETDALLPPFVTATPGRKNLTHTSAPFAGGPFRASGPAVARVASLDPAATMGRLMRSTALGSVALVVTLGAQAPLAVFRSWSTDHSWQRLPVKPTPVKGIADGAATDVAVARYYGCARLTDGTLRCWGNSAGSVLSDGFEPSRVAEPRAGLGPFEAMAVGDRRMCVIGKVGESRALCWGDNEHGLLGSTESGGLQTVPTEVGPRYVKALAFGDKFTIALTADGKVHRWGVSSMPCTGSGAGDVTPRPIDFLDDIVTIAAAGEHACAIDREGHVTCWGENHYGASGPKINSACVGPTRIEGLDGRAESLSLAAEQSWAKVRRPDGSVAWWGWGQRGVWAPNQPVVVGQVDTNTEARLVAGTEDFDDIHLAYGHACARRYNGSVACWGNGDDGQLGDGLDERAPRGPIEALPPGSALQLSGIGEMSCARGPQKLWCWGVY